VPKAIESVPFDAETESVTSQMSNNNNNNNSSNNSSSSSNNNNNNNDNSNASGVVRTDVLENSHGVSVSSSGSSSGDPDGFAAYLAARIRTKAELKQVR
jgi:hypothetical protein